MSEYRIMLITVSIRNETSIIDFGNWIIHIVIAECFHKVVYTITFLFLVTYGLIYSGINIGFPSNVGAIHKNYERVRVGGYLQFYR